ncbi:MAG: hypothetical protein AAGI23_15485 [Bacteroidota bacterium]
MSQYTDFVATDHAYQRAKERLGWKRKTLDRMMSKAFKEGYTHGQTKSKLQKYITKLWFEHKHANNTRIYGEVIYFFSDNVLITLYQLDRKLLKCLKLSKQ